MMEPTYDPDLESLEATLANLPPRSSLNLSATLIPMPEPLQLAPAHTEDAEVPALGLSRDDSRRSGSPANETQAKAAPEQPRVPDANADSHADARYVQRTTSQDKGDSTRSLGTTQRRSPDAIDPGPGTEAVPAVDGSSVTTPTSDGDIPAEPHASEPETSSGNSVRNLAAVATVHRILNRQRLAKRRHVVGGATAGHEATESREKLLRESPVPTDSGEAQHTDKGNSGVQPGKTPNKGSLRSGFDD